MTRPEIRLRLQAIEHDRSIEKKARIVPRETREAARGSERCFARGGVYWTSLRANRFVILHVLRERTMIVLGTDTVSESMAGRSHRQFSLGCMISRRRSSWRRRRGNPHRNRFPDGRKMFWRRRSPRNRRSDLGSWASNKSGSSAHRENRCFAEWRAVVTAGTATLQGRCLREGCRAPLTLVIANKNYSSWSLRAWLAMTEADIPFAERLVKFDSPDWVANIAILSPTRLVPVLWEGDPGAGFATFDTLAILERLHELHPEAAIWPADATARARAPFAGRGLSWWISGAAQRHADEHSQQPPRQGHDARGAPATSGG